MLKYTVHPALNVGEITSQPFIVGPASGYSRIGIRLNKGSINGLPTNNICRIIGTTVDPLNAKAMNSLVSQETAFVIPNTVTAGKFISSDQSEIIWWSGSRVSLTMKGETSTFANSTEGCLDFTVYLIP